MKFMQRYVRGEIQVKLPTPLCVLVMRQYLPRSTFLGVQFRIQTAASSSRDHYRPENTAMSPLNISNLTDKIALVTGASSGLGRAIAEAYAAEGAFVVSADLSPDPPVAHIFAAEKKDSGEDLTTPTVDLLNEAYPAPTGPRNPRAKYVRCDVTQAASVEKAVAFAVEHYGRLDIMVCNAGIR